MIYHMKGQTVKGKQRIQQHGRKWQVVEKRPGTFGGVLLESLETGGRRWLTEDFIVQRIEND